jgi:chromosomal replication initiator protein
MTQEVTRDAQEVVSALRQGLVDRIGTERFGLWFDQQVRFEVEAGCVVVQVADQFILDRIRKQFRKEIATVVRQIAGVDSSLDFQIDSRAKATVKPISTVNARKPDSPAVTKSKSPPTRPPRNNSDRHRGLESFVVGPGNQIAVTAGRSVGERPGAMSPLFLYGPPGCGKSHISQAICATVRKSAGLRRVVSLSSEQFTSLFLGALHGSGLPSFRRKVREVDVLAVDDIQFFAGKRATLVELQHTIDSLLRNGKQLVLTADRPASDLTKLGPELITRLSGGLVCGIEPADYETRLGIAKQLAVRCRRAVPEDVLQLVAAELTGDARQIAGALNRLDASSEALKQTITIDFAKTALADIFRATVRVVQLSDIERAVCSAFALEPKTLRENCKAKSVSHPRMLAMWLARKYTRAAFSEISEYFGRRSHSTVISAEKKVNRWVADSATVQLGQGACNVEDAIRRVEMQLRTG